MKSENKQQQKPEKNIFLVFLNKYTAAFGFLMRQVDR